MAKYVEFKGDVVEFPDSMSDDDIASVLSKQSAPTKKEAAPKQEESMGSEILRQVGLTARGALSGISSLPAMAGDVINTGINAMLPEGVAPLQMPSQVIQKGMTAAGLPEPKNQLERAVQAGVGAMTGVGTEAALVKAAGTPQALAPLTQNIGTQVAAAGAAAPVAQAVGETVGEVTESPVAALAAGLATGIIAGGTVNKIAQATSRINTGALKGQSPVEAAGTILKQTQGEKPVTIEQVKQQATDAYDRVKNAGIDVKPLSAQGIIKNIQTSLDEGFQFNPELSGHSDVAKTIARAQKIIGDKRISFSELDKVRKSFLDLTQSKDATTRALASNAVKTFDESLASLDTPDIMTGKELTKTALADLAEARNKWRTAAKAQVLQDILDVSELKATNPKASENDLIRDNITKLLANKTKRKVFSSNEQDALKAVINSGTSDTVLSLIANLNPMRSRFMTIASGIGGVAGGVTGIVPGAVGLGADVLQSNIRRNQLQNTVSGMLTGNLPSNQMSPGLTRSYLESLRAQQNNQ